MSDETAHNNTTDFGLFDAATVVGFCGVLASTFGLPWWGFALMIKPFAVSAGFLAAGIAGVLWKWSGVWR